MSKPWSKIALCSVLLFTVAGAPVDATEIASSSDLADPLCAPHQLCGQYECVTSVPLSEDEVRVSLAYLAALQPLSDRPTAASVIAAQQQAHRD